MRSTADLVGYLNQSFAPEIWRPASDIIPNRAVSDVADRVDDFPLISGVLNTRVDFSRLPAFRILPNGSVQLRIPGDEAHQLQLDIAVTDPIPDPTITVNFAVELGLGAAAPVQNLHISADFDWISDFLIFLLGAPAVILKHLFQDIISLIIPELVRGDVERALGGLTTYRFDRAPDLTWQPAASPPIVGVFPPGVTGSRDPSALGYVDILLVADGYQPVMLQDFEALAVRTAAHLAGGSDEVSPFRNFRSAIRVWRMSLFVEQPTQTSQRAVLPVRTQDRITLNFSNLARIAEIGLTALSTFRRPPIIVFASRISDSDRANAGINPQDFIRANTQGPFVLLNLPPIAVPAVREQVTDATIATLIHELGHTPLGHYLADEYEPDASCPDDPTKSCPKVYHGPEPRPRNVSTNPAFGLIKWAPWNTSGTTPQLNAQLGGYEYNRGIFRFQSDCRMRTTSGGNFCPVCREELALGLLEWGHARAGTSSAGMVDVLIEYLAPWTAPARLLHVEGGSTVPLDVFNTNDPSELTTRVRLQIVGSSVPESNIVSWRILRNGGVTPFISSTADMRSVEIDLGVGATFELIVRHDMATGIYGPRQPTPETRVQFAFTIERQVTAVTLRPPTNLTQSVPLGASFAPVVDPRTGRLSLPQPLWVSARLGRVEGFRLLTEVEFRLQGSSGFELPHVQPPSGQESVERQWLINRIVPAGRYVWSARTVWRNVRGTWVDAPRSQTGFSFEVQSVPIETSPRPPLDPFDLVLVESLTDPPLPRGLQASSWHPNDRRINFQFELKLDQEPFTGQNLLETGLLSRDPRQIETMAITGHVFFTLLPQPSQIGDFYKWRVRAVDDALRTSAWVEGRRFFVALPTRRPQSLEDLSSVLKDVRVRDLLDPRGPREVPRLFLDIGDSAADAKVDWSRLARRRSASEPS